MIAQFALRLIFGMSLMWALMPRGRVTAGFFRIQMLVALGFSVLAALTMGRLSAQPADSSQVIARAGTVVCVLLGLASFLGSVMWTLGRRTAGTMLLFVVAVLSAAALLVLAIGAASAPPVGRWFQFASELSSAALLGGALTGMLLGHWYLTAPTMSIAPLVRVTQYFAAAAAFRLLLSAIGLFLAWGALSGVTHGVWLGLRWIAGIFGPLLIAGMTLRILQFRNTQAATGVLFVGVILTFIGEMAASLLSVELSTPL